VILYADTVTGSMERMIEETTRRRKKQLKYNQIHGITPVTIYKSVEEVLAATAIADVAAQRAARKEGARTAAVSDSIVKYLTEEQRRDLLAELKEEMRRAAKDLEFERAAELRDEIARLEKKGEK
jgi:excinuclease ABC subunit B